MSRYLLATYADVNTLPNPYSLYLMFDGVAFLAESALFFVMSRALSEDRWRTYYGAVLVLLVVDSIWGSVSWYCHGGPTTLWVTFNLSFTPVVPLVFLFTPPPKFWGGPLARALAPLLRTMLHHLRTRPPDVLPPP